MKRLKDVSLFAALCIALMAFAIAASPSMEIGCQAQSYDAGLGKGEAPGPIGSVLFGLHFTRISFESGSDQSSDRCDSDGESVHAHGCHSHALTNVSTSILTPCSPSPSLIANEHFLSGGTVQPPAKPPRILA